MASARPSLRRSILVALPRSSRAATARTYLAREVGPGNSRPRLTDGVSTDVVMVCQSRHGSYSS
jgi:hypothetical protein